MKSYILYSALVLSCAAAANNATTPVANLTASDGCTTLQNSKDAGEKITKVTFKWAARGAVVHTGLEVETKKGKYALAYNSKGVPSTVNSPGQVWCQSGGMPMKNSLANGDCPGCGGWGSAGDHSGDMKSLKDFMGDVKSFGDSHSNYNLLACTNGGNEANCQLTANHLYKKLAGKYPDHSGCPECPGECNK
eukprot:g7218.t1